MERQSLRAGALTIEIERDADVVVVRQAGELDISSAPTLERQLNELGAIAGSSVVLDLAALTFIDSTGLQCLLRVSRRAAGADGNGNGSGLRMTRARHEDVIHLLDLTGIGSTLPIADSA